MAVKPFFYRVNIHSLFSNSQNKLELLVLCGLESICVNLDKGDRNHMSCPLVFINKRMVL